MKSIILEILTWLLYRASLSLYLQSSLSGGIPSSSSVHWEGSGYGKWPSTSSESCQKRQRIQNHMNPLYNSPWNTWDLVSWGNCLYRGSMCTPPPALQNKTRLTACPFSKHYVIQNSSEWHPGTKANVSPLHWNTHSSQSLEILIFY